MKLMLPWLELMEMSGLSKIRWRWVLGITLTFVLLGSLAFNGLSIHSNRQTSDKLDARITKLGTALTAVVEGIQPDLERLDDRLLEMSQQSQRNRESHQHLALYANAISQYYAALLYVSLDPDTLEDAKVRVGNALAFDPVLLSAWEGTQEGVFSFSFFATFLLGKFFVEWAALEGREPPEDWDSARRTSR